MKQFLISVLLCVVLVGCGCSCDKTATVIQYGPDGSVVQQYDNATVIYEGESYVKLRTQSGFKVSIKGPVTILYTDQEKRK